MPILGEQKDLGLFLYLLFNSSSVLACRMGDSVSLTSCWAPRWFIFFLSPHVAVPSFLIDLSAQLSLDPLGAGCCPWSQATLRDVSCRALAALLAGLLGHPEVCAETPTMGQ